MAKKMSMARNTYSTFLHKYRGYIVLAASMLDNSGMCNSFFLGNLTSYIYALQYSRSDDQISRDIDPSWMLSLYLVMRMVAICILDITVRKCGMKRVIGVCMVLSSLSLLLTYFTSNHSVWAATITLVIMGSLGKSMCGMCELIYIADWFDNNVGIATALFSGSCAIGGIIYNQVITSYVNPNNYAPDAIRGHISYFSQPEVVESVPGLFLILGIITTALHCVAFPLLSGRPTVKDMDDENNNKGNGTFRSHKQRSDLSRACNSEDETSVCTMVDKEHSTSPTIIVTPCCSIHNQPNKRNKQMLDGSERNESKEHFGGSICDGVRDSMHDQHHEQTPIMIKASQENSKEIMLIDNGRCESKSETLVATVDDINLEENTFWTPVQVLKCANFYFIQLASMAIALGYILVVNYYKLFGQLYIKDDQFFAFIGSTMSLFVVLSYILCGVMIDRIGVKITWIVHLSASCISLMLWYFIPLLNRSVYLLWVVVLCGIHYNMFFLLPMTCLRLYGKKYYATNYGISQIASLIAFFIGPPLISGIVSNFGWFWLFCTSGVLSLIGLIPIVTCMSRV